MTLTGREKATIFLSILGADVASRILRYLPDELADLIAAGINHLPTPSPEALAEVMGDYQGYLALPESEAETAPRIMSSTSTTRKNYSILLYERPQLIAFVLSLMEEEEKLEALSALSRGKPIIEELYTGLKETPLRPRIAEQLKNVYAGKIF